MTKFAARVADAHFCPQPLHRGGPIREGSPNVEIGGPMAARVLDPANCVGDDFIVVGSLGVIINNRGAAGVGDATLHGGLVTSGLPSVLIGNGKNPLANSAGEINPGNCQINCGRNIDAALDRLYGRNPNATATCAMGGSFPQIAARHSTEFVWGKSLDDVLAMVRRGGHGTTALLGIRWKNGQSHVVIVTNHYGTPTIVEGQTWGPDKPASAISDPRVANQRYPGKDFGVGMLPNKPL